MGGSMSSGMVTHVCATECIHVYGSTLVQAVACRLFGSKPLPEPTDINKSPDILLMCFDCTEMHCLVRHWPVMCIKCCIAHYHTETHHMHQVKSSFRFNNPVNKTFAGQSVLTTCLLVFRLPCAQDVLGNDNHKLDATFKLSFMMDIVNAIIYLHKSVIMSHGNLKSSNCLVDARWIVKVTKESSSTCTFSMSRPIKDDNSECVKWTFLPFHCVFYSLLFTAIRHIG